MRLSAVALVALVSLAGGARAASISLDFDSVAGGSLANDAAAGTGLAFDFAAFLPELDAYGDPIPGSDAYRPDPAPVDAVRVGDPSPFGYGTAPSGPNALNALDQGVLITFDGPKNLTQFSITLDKSGFGFPGTFDVVIQDESGAVLQSIVTQQSVPGFIASFSGNLTGVRSIYLPGGAFYDDLHVETPEPGALLILAVALGLLSSARWIASSAGTLPRAS